MLLEGRVEAAGVAVNTYKNQEEHTGAFYVRCGINIPCPLTVPHMQLATKFRRHDLASSEASDRADGFNFRQEKEIEPAAEIQKPVSERRAENGLGANGP